MKTLSLVPPVLSEKTKENLGRKETDVNAVNASKAATKPNR